MIRGSRIATLHRWVGLGAALWLAVVGITGFLLDHKDWRWMRQATVDERWLPESLAKTARDLLVRFYQVERGNPASRVAAGWRGAWFSRDGGQSWTPSRFEGTAGTLLVYALEPDFEQGRVWLATDDGVWLSEDAGAVYRRHALPDQRVTSLSRGIESGSLLTVINRSSVVMLGKADAKQFTRLQLSEPLSPALKDEGLARLLVNLHLGWGLLPSPWNMLLNDLVAWGFVLLPLTGCVVWLRRRRSRRADAAVVRTAFSRWWLRGHVYLLGIVLLAPLGYFAASGVLLVHRELRAEVDSIRINPGFLPPGYRAGWRNEIASVIVTGGAQPKMLVATRRGLFSTTDGGASWRAESLAGKPFGAVFGLRRAGDDIFVIGAVGGRCVPDDVCKPVAGLHGMVSDVAVLSPGETVTISHHGIQPLMTSALAAAPAHEHANLPMPELAGVPVQFVVNQIHSTSLFFGDNKRWVNDVGAAAIALMLLTGLVRGVVLLRRGSL